MKNKEFKNDAGVIRDAQYLDVQLVDSSLKVDEEVILQILFTSVYFLNHLIINIYVRFKLLFGGKMLSIYVVNLLEPLSF